MLATRGRESFEAEKTHVHFSLAPGSRDLGKTAALLGQPCPSLALQQLLTGGMRDASE